MRRWVGVLVVVLAGQAALHGQQKANTSAFTDAGITASPAFSDKELGAPPTANWLKNGGNLFNQNYSPLKQINRENVTNLKSQWCTHLDGSGTPRKYSGKAQHIIHNAMNI